MPSLDDSGKYQDRCAAGRDEQQGEYDPDDSAEPDDRSHPEFEYTEAPADWKNSILVRRERPPPGGDYLKMRASVIGHQRASTLPTMDFFGTRPQSRLSELSLR